MRRNDTRAAHAGRPRGRCGDPVRRVAPWEVLTLGIASEALGANPLVTVNGHAAFHANNVGLDYSYLYTVLGSDPGGPAAIAVSGVDAAGNAGMLTDNGALSITEPLSGLPVAAWPLGPALAAVATRTLRRRPLG